MNFQYPKKKISLLEGSSTTIRAVANGAIKVYWILKDGDNIIELSTDRLTQIIKSGRVSGNKQLTLLFKAIYVDTIKTIMIPILIQENIPDPTFTIQIPKKWNGRDKLEIIPILNNIKLLKDKKAANLTYKWNTADIAVSKKILLMLVAPPKILILKMKIMTFGLSIWINLLLNILIH